MIRRLMGSIVLFLILATGTNSHAQKIKIDSAKILSGFIPQEKVLFEDDFSHDRDAGSPSYWQTEYYNSANKVKAYESSKHCKVHKTGDKYAMFIRNVWLEKVLPNDNVNDNQIEPVIANSLPDSFSLEYDFKMKPNSSPALLFYDTDVKCFCPWQPILIFKSEKGWEIDQGTLTDDRWRKLLENEIAIPSEIDCNDWHHFALSYNKRKLKCYLDNKEILDVPDCKYSPKRFFLSAIPNDKYSRYNYVLSSIDYTSQCKYDSLAFTNDSIAFTNVRLASGRYDTAAAFDIFKSLLTNKKFTTHAINFDVNKSTIKPGSIDFIRQLAEWLKQNPAVRLEIDGHTDSDGDAAANMKLSQARAEEVKRQLVILGVNSDRLTAKGYGASKPVSPNSTDKGKAENRRVEFIKL